MAIINNVAYSWSMITLSSTALGIDEGSTTLEGVSAIKWSKKRKVESNYGMGGRPVSRGFGNITYTASITMDYATQQLLRSVYGSLLEIGEFDLIISGEFTYGSRAARTARRLLLMVRFRAMVRKSPCEHVWSFEM